MNKFKLYIALLVVLVINGCTMFPTEQKPSELATTHGYVYYNILNYHHNLPFSLQSKTSGRTYTLRLRNDSGAVAFGLWIPEGDYSLTKWNGYKLSGYPDIVIKAGKVTDLGTFRTFDVGGYDFYLVPFTHPSTSAWINTALKSFGDYLIGNEVIAWRPSNMPDVLTTPSPDAPPSLGITGDLISSYIHKVNKPGINRRLRETKKINDFLLLAKQLMLPVMHESIRSPAGSHLWGAEFGQIRRRSTAGQWSNIDTGYLEKVIAVESSDGWLMAALYDSPLIVGRREGSDTWEELYTMKNNERVVDIDFNNGRWMVVTISTTPWKHGGFLIDNVFIYEGKSLDFSDLKIIRELPWKKYILPEAYGRFTKDAYVVYAFESLHRYDFDSKSWSDITPPSRTLGFNSNKDNATLTAYAFLGAFSKLEISTDQGDSWTKLIAPPYIQHSVYFEEKESGWATRWNMGMFSGRLNMHYYQPGMRRWKLDYAAPHGCIKFLHQEKSPPQLCITKSGSILHYQHKEWTVEFATD